LERQGHHCFERRGVIPAILESAPSHTLTSETTTLLTPKSESGSSSCTLVKSAKTSSVVRPADLPGPGPAPSAWKLLAELRICPRILQANRVAHASHSCASLSRLCSTHLQQFGRRRQPTAPRCPRSKAGLVQRVLHLLHFSKHCCSRKDSPTRQVCDHPFQDR
jgi:hypothetical protein